MVDGVVAGVVVVLAVVAVVMVVDFCIIIVYSKQNETWKTNLSIFPLPLLVGAVPSGWVVG